MLWGKGVDYERPGRCIDLAALELLELVRERAARLVTDSNLPGFDALATDLYCDFLERPGTACGS